MEKKEKKGSLSKRFWLIISTVCVVLLIFAIVGIVVFSNRKPQLIKKTEKGGNVTLNYSSTSNILQINNGGPISDAFGIVNNEAGMYFDFTVKTDITNAKKVDYEIAVKKISLDTNVPDNNIKVYLEKEDSGTYNSVFKPKLYTPLKKKTELGTEKGSMVLVKQTRNKTTEDNYRLRTWISEDSLITAASYSLQVNIKAKAK